MVNEQKNREQSIRSTNNMVDKGQTSHRDSPLSMATSSTSIMIFDDGDTSWDNGSWDDHVIDVGMQDEEQQLMDANDDGDSQSCKSAESAIDDGYDSEASDRKSIQQPASQSGFEPIKNSPSEEHQHSASAANCKEPAPQSPVLAQTKCGAPSISASEFQCQCLELIMPLPEYNRQPPETPSHASRYPNELPDGTATKTLPDGTSVLINYDKLLRNEVTKRILLQRSIESYTNTIDKLHARLKAAEAKDRDARTSTATAAQQHDEMFRRQVELSREWLRTKAKSKSARVTVKVMLVLSIVWLALINASVHSAVVQNLPLQQQIVENQRRVSFLRKTGEGVKDRQNDVIDRKDSSETEDDMELKNAATSDASTSSVEGNGGTNDLTFSVGEAGVKNQTESLQLA